MPDMNAFERVKAQKDPNIARVYTVSTGPSEQYNALTPSQFIDEDWEDWYFWCPMPIGTYYAKELLEMMLVMMDTNTCKLMNKKCDKDTQCNSGIYWIVEVTLREVVRGVPSVVRKVRSEIETVLEENRFPEDEQRRIRGEVEDDFEKWKQERFNRGQYNRPMGDSGPVKSPTDTAPAPPAAPRSHRPTKALPIVDPTSAPRNTASAGKARASSSGPQSRNPTGPSQANNQRRPSESTRYYAQLRGPTTSDPQSVNAQAIAQTGTQRSPLEHYRVTDLRSNAEGNPISYPRVAAQSQASVGRTAVPSMPPGSSASAVGLGYHGVGVGASGNVFAGSSPMHHPLPPRPRNRGASRRAPSGPRGHFQGRRIVYSAPPVNAPSGPRSSVPQKQSMGSSHPPVNPHTVAPSNAMPANAMPGNAPLGPHANAPVNQPAGHYNTPTSVPQGHGNTRPVSMPAVQQTNQPMGYENAALMNPHVAALNALMGPNNLGVANTPTGHDPTSPNMARGNHMVSNAPMGRGNAAFPSSAMGPGQTGYVNPPSIGPYSHMLKSPMVPCNAGFTNTPVGPHNNMAMANAPMVPPRAPTPAPMHTDTGPSNGGFVALRPYNLHRPMGNAHMVPHSTQYPNPAMGSQNVPAARVAQAHQGPHAPQAAYVTQAAQSTHGHYTAQGPQTPQGPAQSYVTFSYPTTPGPLHGHTASHSSIASQVARRWSFQMAEEEAEAMRQRSKKAAGTEVLQSLGKALKRKAQADPETAD